jgi:glucose/arabinose dehydrogenase
LARRQLGALILGLVVAAACGDDDDAGGAKPGGADAGGPVVKKAFPLKTPSLGGYTLEDAFPGVVFDIPAAIAWPKKPGSMPIVLERTGQLRTIENGQRKDLLDFSEKVHIAGEGGAVGLVLHPSFGTGAENQYAYVWYNACDVPNCENPYSQRLERYTWDAASGEFDAGSATLLIEQSEYENVHNAGKMLFGPNDGFLYFGNGDDATKANHQTITRGLFAGIFRIDVDQNPAKSHAPPAHTPPNDDPDHPINIFTRQNYSIPNDNPFVGKVADGLEEFYALGFRNPFSFSFDRKTGDLWMGDVGDTFREEVNQVLPGANYEWPIKEGENDWPGTSLKNFTVGTRTPPKYAYAHNEMGDLTAIFGGYVYRGHALAELAGKYVYSDWLSNRVWALDLGASPPVRTTLIDNQFQFQPMGLGEDNDGEVYILQYGTGAGGFVKKLVKANNDPFPTRLVETDLFTDVAKLVPAPDLVPYDVSSPLWSDGAEKKRWIRVPAGQKITTKDDGSLVFPPGTVFVKQFDVFGRHVETRVMVVGTETTYGYTFRWNREGTDATIVTDGADETLEDPKTGTSQNWHYPSFGQCWECHRNGFEDDANEKRNDRYRILGFTGAQVMPREQLMGRGVFDANVKLPDTLPSPKDTSRSIEERAHAYLAANCSPCHHEHGSYEGGGETWLANFGAGDLAARHLDQEAANVPMTLRLGLPNGKLIEPGQPDKSVLLQRIKTNDPDLRMPPLARNVVDAEGAAIIEQWIAGMR